MGRPSSPLGMFYVFGSPTASWCILHLGCRNRTIEHYPDFLRYNGSSHGITFFWNAYTPLEESDSDTGQEWESADDKYIRWRGSPVLCWRQVRDADLSSYFNCNFMSTRYLVLSCGHCLLHCFPREKSQDSLTVTQWQAISWQLSRGTNYATVFPINTRQPCRPQWSRLSLISLVHGPTHSQGRMQNMSRRQNRHRRLSSISLWEVNTSNSY